MNVSTTPTDELLHNLRAVGEALANNPAYNAPPQFAIVIQQALSAPPASAKNETGIEPFMWLKQHEFNEMRMPASSNRYVTGWRQPQDKAGNDLVPLYAPAQHAMPPVFGQRGGRSAACQTRIAA